MQTVRRSAAPDVVAVAEFLVDSYRPLCAILDLDDVAHNFLNGRKTNRKFDRDEIDESSLETCVSIQCLNQCINAMDTVRLRCLMGNFVILKSVSNDFQLFSKIIQLSK